MKFSKIVSLVLLMCFMTLIPVNAVEAAEVVLPEEEECPVVNIFDDVCSQEDYEGLKLEWKYAEDSLYDILSVVKSDDRIVAEYEYDDMHRRVSKRVGREVTEITYDEFSRISTISVGRNKLDYVYSSENFDMMSGFIYKGHEYEFEYTNHIITGIMEDGNLVAKYVYSGLLSEVEVQSYENGEWVTNTDKKFVGNINKIRLSQMFHDEETGWYYAGRYYDPEQSRYVDGISPFEAYGMEEKYGSGVLLKAYNFGLPYVGNPYMRDSMSTQEKVGRVLYMEAGTSAQDWTAVAIIVYNRMAGGSSAWDVLTCGAFSAYNSGSYLFSTSGWYNQSKWNKCMENATLLCNNTRPASVTGITNQVSFRRVSTFIAGYESDGTTQKFEGSVISNVAIPGYGTIYPSVTDASIYQSQDGVFNIYFN